MASNREESVSEAQRWKDCLGDWSEDDPDVLGWLHKEKQPVVADVDGTLKMLHSGLLYPHEMYDGELGETLDDLGEPSVVSLSSQSGRFDKEMFEWDREELKR